MVQSKRTTTTSVNGNNLFDNPMVRSARASMTPEQIEEYKRIGEDMYNTVDFETSQIIDENHTVESVAYIVEALKSGMHPDYLDDNEKEVLKMQYGDNWLDRFKHFY